MRKIAIVLIMFSYFSYAHVEKGYRKIEDPCVPPCCTKFAQKGDEPYYEYNCVLKNVKCYIRCALCCECEHPELGTTRSVQDCGWYRCHSNIQKCIYIGGGNGSSGCLGFPFDDLECLEICNYDCSWNFANCQYIQRYPNCDCEEIIEINDHWTAVGCF